MRQQKKIPLDYEKPVAVIGSPMRDSVHLLLHVLLTLLPVLSNAIVSREDEKMIVMYVGLGVGTATSYYLFRESRFRKWAKILFFFYAPCAGWLLILQAMHLCSIRR